VKKIFILALVIILASVGAPVWAQSPKMSAGEKAQPMAQEMLPKMQEMMQDMQKMLGQEKITPEQQKKMQEMMGKMQGMMPQMSEKMAAMPKEKMAMCPMMNKMEDQAKSIKALEERLDKLEKTVGKSK
jgi:DNA repair ATPase RecN